MDSETAAAIRAAYSDVRDDKTPTNWLICEFENETAKHMCLAATGSGGLAEFVAALKDDQVAYGYLRMSVSNDSLSTRSKFVLVSWCGPQVKVLRKAKLGVYLSEIKPILNNYAIEKYASDRHDLQESELLLSLKKAMGANYDRQATDY